MTDRTPTGGLREGTCEHCGKPIVFEPFFLDGKRPNPPIWFHPGGGKTCSTIPPGWTDPGWPRATPKETTMPEPTGDLRERLAEAEETLAEVRRLCELTIACSCRAHAIEQAEDTLRILNRHTTKGTDPT